MWGNEHTARASWAGSGVLGGSLVAGAVQGILLAARALGLGSTDAASARRGLAAGNGGVDHFELFDGVLGVRKRNI